MSVKRRDALLLLGAGAGAGLLAGCSFGGGKPKPGPVPVTVSPTPRPTDTSGEGHSHGLISGSLRDRIGVNVHWHYYDTPYGQYDKVKELLVASGLRHVRGQLIRAEDLARSGVRTTLPVDFDPQGRGNPFDLVKQAEPLIKSGAIVAVEGPNEPDLFWANSGFTYKGKKFPAGALAYQKDLYKAVKSNKNTRRIPVIGMSMGRNYWSAPFPYAKGALASSADFGNFHPYPSGNPFNPERYRYAGINDYFANADYPSITLDQYPINFATYRPAYNQKRMVATETGYSTYYLGQSEVVQGWYIARMILEFARLGIRRTYIYELLDEFNDPERTNREAHFGLLRHNLTPKPSYNAVKSLMNAVGDGIPVFGTASVRGLHYEIAVDPPRGYNARSLHHLAFAMPDGSTSIALWNEISAEDTSPLARQKPVRRVGHPPMEVQVKVTARRQARTHQPAASRLGDDGHWDDLNISRTDNSATMNVDGRVVVLRL